MKELWRSPTLPSILIHGAAGVGFAGANLILARVLPKTEYGLFTLVIALINLGFALAPLGAEGMVMRHRLDPSPRLLARMFPAMTFTSVVFTLIALIGYRISVPLSLLIGISTIAGGVMVVAACQFQGEHRFGLSLALLHSPNAVLLLAAIAVVVSGWNHAWPPVLISTVGFIVAATLGWGRLFHERRHSALRDTSFSWREAFTLAGVQAAGLLLIQLERLIMPRLLPVDDLATYGVLAAIAGSLFRVLQMGVGYTLLPRLRAAPTVQDRRRLVAHEARLAGTIVVLGAVLILVVTPFIEHHVLADKYHLSLALLIAAIVSGVAKILNAFTKATVTALAKPRELAILNVVGWLCVAAAIVAAVIGARWGLIGVIYGVGLGWMLRAASAFYLTARHLSD